jgi:hypothetical protein
MNEVQKQLIEEAKEWASVFYDKDEPEFIDEVAKCVIELTLQHVKYVIDRNIAQGENAPSLTVAIDSITSSREEEDE